MSSAVGVELRGFSLAILIACSGCSLVFMERIPATLEPGAPRTCTKDTEIPWWDVIVGSASAGIGAATTVAAVASSDDRSGRLTIGAVLLGLGAAYGYSAYRGFAMADDCAAATNQRHSRDKP